MGENFKYLFGRYFDKQATTAERSEFLELLKTSDYDALLEHLMDDYYAEFIPRDNPFSVEAEQRMLKVILDAGIKQGDNKVRKLWPSIPLRWAAAILLIIGSALFFYLNQYYAITKQESYTANDIAPGKNTATLTLSDGKRIILSDAIKGQLAQEAGVEISKAADGQLVYEIAESSLRDKVKRPHQYNTLTTAHGEQYRVRLPDGTNVWLNSTSSLTYPTSFISAKNRIVQLKGEGYFEVAKDKMHPFIVKTDKQKVEVLGTHFNINSYADEQNTKTTLLEGSVKVSSSLTSLQEDSGRSLRGGTTKQPFNAIILKPGQQAILSNQNVKVEEVEAEYAIAWKNEYFSFNEEKIENIMRQLSRWYAIEVFYAGDVSSERFNAKISRSKNISQILRALESTKLVHFKIEGRRVTVMRE